MHNDLSGIMDHVSHTDYLIYFYIIDTISNH